MLDAIAQSRMGRWVHLKDTRAYSVLRDMDATCTYAVLGLTQPLRIIGMKDDKVMGSGLVIKATLVPLGARRPNSESGVAGAWLQAQLRSQLYSAA